MDSPPASKDSTCQAKIEVVEPTAKMKNPQSQDVRVEPKEENSDIDQQRSPLPPLPKDRDDKHPGITPLFTKPPRKQPRERDSLKSTPRRKEKAQKRVVVAKLGTTKENGKKLLRTQ